MKRQKKQEFSEPSFEPSSFMVKNIAIECPHCNQTFEVFLSSNASMVILNCPTCLTPLVYYKTRCFELNQKQVDRIRNSKQESTVLRIIHSIAHDDTLSAKHHTCTIQTATAEKYIAPSATFLSRGRYITQDDVINLRITLETCTDSKQFIELL
jgi:hypothetical protein